jgi:hypothetical protein
MSTAPETTAEAGAGEHLVALEHPMFSRIAGISFRRSASDGTAVMVVPFEDREASVPLKGLQREFDIPDESPDGRMLVLIAEALHYVTALYPGDPLPAEVTSGEASWSPAGNHLRRAQIRLRVALLGWQDPAAAKLAIRDLEGGGRMETDPELKTAMQHATRRAAGTLNCAGPDEVLARLEALSNEFAYIESLRDRLLLRVQALVTRAKRMSGALSRTDVVRLDAITRVIKMTGTSVDDMEGRFGKIDEICHDIIALLREPEVRIAFVRENRDALYRTQLGWEPILEQWDHVDEDDEVLLWQVVANTYQFLARRYLAVTEWPSFLGLRESLGTSKRNMMRW